jgi:hypothetical protein
MTIFISDNFLKNHYYKLLQVKYYYSQEMNILIADRSLKLVLQVITGKNL